MLDNITDQDPFLLSAHPFEDALAHQSQVQLERIYSKHQTHRCIANAYEDAGFKVALIKENIPTKFGIDLLVQIYLHKRAPINVLIGLLKKHFIHSNPDNPAQACADMILTAAAVDVLDYENMTDMFIVRWAQVISPELQAKIDQFQYPLPMIEEPNKVTHNKQTGYQTIPGSVILKNNHHEDDVCLDHINRVNKVPLKLNADVVAFMQNTWKNLDKKKPDETQDEYEIRLKAFQKFDWVSRDVLAGILAQNNKFWLTHKYDKRGRTYTMGYQINYQGNDWQKACVEFSESEPLNPL